MSDAKWAWRCTMTLDGPVAEPDHLTWKMSANPTWALSGKGRAMNKPEMILAGLMLMLVAGVELCGAAQTGLLDGRVTVADSAGLNPPADFTLEAWIKPYQNGGNFMSKESSYLVTLWWDGSIYWAMNNANPG